MKTLAGTILSFVAVGLVAACASKQEDPTPAAGANDVRAGNDVNNNKLEGRVSAGEATPKIAAAECEREMKCENVGENRQYTSLNECKRARGEELAKDFNGDEDCKHGILRKDLEECITRTVEQICRESVVTNVRVSAACGSNDLCVE